eukprot:359696-Chlamydomonas_euryale.AAC.1
MPIKTIIKELLWMLRGESDSKILEAQGVNIWKGNTSRKFLDKRGLTDYPEGETGPLYGASLRKYRDGKVDQLENTLKGIAQDPYSRRHIMTTYDPSVLDKCVLMPCHGICTQFYCHEKNRGLSCHVYCRSSDVFLGLPFNIASYALLVFIMAKKTDRTPVELIVSTGDTHLYTNHESQAKQQLERNPIVPPVLEVCESVKTKSWEEITDADLFVAGYFPRPAISAPMAV